MTSVAIAIIVFGIFLGLVIADGYSAWAGLAVWGLALHASIFAFQQGEAERKEDDPR